MKVIRLSDIHERFEFIWVGQTPPISNYQGWGKLRSIYVPHAPPEKDSHICGCLFLLLGHKRFTSRATARVANPAQITPRRRVDKLACQRGKQVAPIGSIVQIRRVSTKPLSKQRTVNCPLNKK